jgi:hypothetical protein
MDQQLCYLYSWSIQGNTSKTPVSTKDPSRIYLNSPPIIVRRVRCWKMSICRREAVLGHRIVSWSQLGQFKYSGWYKLCNVSLRYPHMNRTIWSRLEEWIRTAVIVHHPEEGSEVHVVTGPLWLPVRRLDKAKFEYCFQGIGQPPALVSVPKHFLK